MFVGVVVAVVLLSQWRWTAVKPRQAAEATPTAASGLALSFSAVANGPVVDAHAARLIALSVPVGESPSPAVKPGEPYVAMWTGLLSSGPRKIKESYRFSAEGTGHLTVTVNDKVVLDVTGDLSKSPSDLITIRKAKNRITAVYTPPATGAAAVRLMWARDDHADYFNPVPPTVFTHDATDASLVQHGKVRLGRELLTTMRCIACHQNLTGGVPELKQDAPNLTGVQRRVTPRS